MNYNSCMNLALGHGYARVAGQFCQNFRTQVGVSLEEASLQQGYALTAAEIRLLSGLDLLGFSDLAHRLNPGLCRAGR